MNRSKYFGIPRRLGLWRWPAVGAGALVVVLGAFRAARATGIPASGALLYSGTLTDASGNPLPSPQSIGLAVYDASDGGKKVCEQSAQSVAVDAGGHFQVSMPDACTTAVQAQPELWVEVSVAGSSLGRSKIGAVPYAVSAGDSARLQGKQAAELEVPSGMIGMFASACPTGWSICNGSSGTPNLIDNYVKAGSTFAASAGSNTHSHTVTGTTSSDGHHYHFVELNWDTGSLTPAGDASIYAGFSALDDTVIDDQRVTASRWTSVGRLDLPGAVGHSDATYSLNAGTPTTSVGDHSHSLSGTTDSQSHEPKHATLLFCMKN